MDAPHQSTVRDDCAGDGEPAGRVLAAVVDWSADAARATAARLTRRCGPSLPVYPVAAAVAAVRRLRPRLVVTELDLPQAFVGLRLVRELRELAADPASGGLRIVVLTGNAGHGVAAQARAAGADDVILKTGRDRDDRLDDACARSGVTAVGSVG